MFQLDNIREKNIEVFNNIYETQGQIKLIESIAEGLGEKTYFSIDKDGKIKRNQLNTALYLLSTLDEKNYKSIIKLVLEEKIHLSKREKIKKIDRLSKYSLETLIKNFNKIMAKGERSFGLRYGKELFLRDKTLFFKMFFDYVLLENIGTKKSIMAWALYKLLWKNEFSDEVFYVGMSYILLRRSNFSNYENKIENYKNPLDKDSIIKSSFKNKSLEIVCYGKILGEFTYEKEEVYLSLLKDKIEE